jgi:hypothetical protein
MRARSLIIAASHVGSRKGMRRSQMKISIVLGTLPEINARANFGRRACIFQEQRAEEDE